MNRKKMTLAFALLAAANIAWSQASTTNDWSWTFRRWGETCGLLFEDGNLASSVKAAIRDDITQVYTYTTRANLYTQTYTSKNTKYGMFTGLDGLQGNHGRPSGLKGLDYKMHNGIPYLHVEKKLSSTYLEKIALTNQYQSAAASLSNFLATVNGITTNSGTAVMATHIGHWWVVANNRALGTKDIQTQSDFEKFVATFGDDEMLAPSILGFMMGTDELSGDLCYEPTYRQRNDGQYIHAAFNLVFKNGQWRVALTFLDVGP